MTITSDFNQTLLAKCYHKSALLRSEEHVNIVVMLLQALAQAVQFHLPVRDANFADVTKCVHRLITSLTFPIVGEILVQTWCCHCRTDCGTK
jgi:hypothetical protein